MNEYMLTQNEKLIQVVHNAFRDFPFYRNKFIQASIDPDTFQGLDDLTKIPFTTKEDLQMRFPFADVYQQFGHELSYIGFTTGTTSAPMPIYFTHEDMDKWEWNLTKAYHMAGINSGDIVQVSIGRCGIGCVVFMGAVRKTGAAVMPVDVDLISTDEILNRMKQYRITILATLPSIASELCRLVEAGYPKEGLALKTLFLMGEACTETFRERARQTLGAEVYDIYGSTESGFVGTECNLHKGLHLMVDQVIVEIVDPTTGLPVQSGAEGELVVTTLWKKAMPLIRYRTGDIASAIQEDCKCNIGLPRISKIKGRASDLVSIGSTKLHPSAIDALIFDTFNKNYNYQVVLSNEQGRDHLALLVEVDIPSIEAAGIQERLEFGILTLTDDMNLLFKSGIILHPEVQLISPGTLQKKGGKVRKIFDKRERKDG
jgi:phenylacetate-CoA ligase